MTPTRIAAQARTLPEWVGMPAPHQANGRIIEAVAKRLGLGLDRVVINLDRDGNTVGATIPIALSEWNEQGRFTHGDRLVLSAFGAGSPRAGSTCAGR